jgi:hypothetical protein
LVLTANIAPCSDSSKFLDNLFLYQNKKNKEGVLRIPKEPVYLHRFKRKAIKIEV